MKSNLLLDPVDEDLRGAANKHVKGRWQLNSGEWLHRVIAERMGLRIEGMHVDHKNLNPDDNTRGNLRVATSGQNRANSRPNKGTVSGFKGVNYKPPRPSTRARRRSDYQGKHWYAQINVDGQKIYIGRFATAEQAARAYDEAAIKHFGEFARPNFPRST